MYRLRCIQPITILKINNIIMIIESTYIRILQNLQITYVTIVHVNTYVMVYRSVRNFCDPDTISVIWE